MASGTLTGSTYHGGYRLEIDWSSVADEANNRSEVTAKVYLKSDSGYGLSFSADKNGNTTINANSLNWVYSGGISTSGGSRHLLHTRTIYVKHNDDGTKDCDLSAWFEPDVKINGTQTGRWSVSGTVTLDKIDRGRINVKVGTAWKNGQVFINVNGVNKQATGVFKNVNGVWERSI